jgi:hypothetical protein
VASEPCEATGAVSGTVCAEPSAGLYRGTCEHGHPAERYLCTGHAEPERPLWCRACYAEGRECPVTLAPVAVAHAVTPGVTSGG